MWHPSARWLVQQPCPQSSNFVASRWLQSSVLILKAIDSSRRGIVAPPLVHLPFEGCPKRRHWAPEAARGHKFKLAQPSPRVCKFLQHVNVMVMNCLWKRLKATGAGNMIGYFKRLARCVLMLTLPETVFFRNWPSHVLYCASLCPLLQHLAPCTKVNSSSLMSNSFFCQPGRS